MDTKLTSKINFKQATPLFLFAVLFFGVVSIVQFRNGIEDLYLGKSFFRTTLPVAIFLFLFSLCSLYHFIVTYRKIIICNEGITFKTLFKRSYYDWSQIKDIKLTGKQPMRFLYISMPVEATSITFIDETKQVVWADNYRNTPLLRAALNKVKKQLSANRPIDIAQFDLDRKLGVEAEAIFLSYKEYSGDLLFSMNGIILFGWIMFILVVVLSKPNVFLSNMGALLSISLVTIVICGMLIYQLHYFVITDTQLIVKNHICFWKNKVYQLSDIVEVAIETPHKRSTSLRVIDKDYISKLYPAGTLRDNTWRDLIEEFINRRITVRNEAYI